MSAMPYQVFLSYHRQDGAAFVRELAARLQRDGVQFWFDEANLAPGEPWQKAIQRDLPRCASCAVFIGPSGVGPWQETELDAALSQQIEANRGFRVIPVLLPGATQDKVKELPLFLQRLTWVEFKDAPDRDDAAYRRLLCGIRGEQPGFVPPPPQYLAATAPQTKIIPRGLRSFEVGDHAWFLRLVPGPRDERGLPAALRFWKDRLERIDPDDTFRIGLLYGPSGCGKSSLVKAGLIPTLAEFVLPIYVEATADHTEAAILRALRKALPSLPADQNLSQTFAALRQQPELAGGRKVVLLLDQFEQWLHAHAADLSGELADALRHCDGGRLQAVLLVRDEFVVSVHRFLAALEIPIQEGRNFALVDLFSLPHARAVLIEYGRAYERLSDPPDASQAAFLSAVVNSLKTPEDKIVCVQLALLAEMLKGRDWTPDNFHGQDGAEGVGLRFFKETFGARSANPDHKVCRRPAMAVLEALLPQSGGDIRGRSRSESALRAAALQADRQVDFPRLLQILDGELRLVTPTELPPGSPAEDAPARADATAEKRYQLTHDYLVPSLRKWLTEEQRESAAGRATLALKTRAAQWKEERKLRFLPGLGEYVRILCFAPGHRWDAVQRAMFRAATVFHAVSVAVVVLLAMGGFAIWKSLQGKEAGNLVQQLLATLPPYVSFAVDRLRPLQAHARPLLAAQLNRPDVTPERQLNAALALAAFGDVRVTNLLASVALPNCVCSNLVRALEPAKAAALRAIPERIRQVTSPDERARLATVAWSLGDLAPLQELTKTNADPANRTAFIHGYPLWPGDPLSLEALLAELKSAPEHADLRSAVCAALGRITWDTNPAAAPAQARLCQTLAQLYTEAPDGGTHGAAAYALTRWGQGLPPLPAPTRQPAPGRDWFVNTQGMTMIQLPAGTFRMGHPEDSRGATPHAVTLARPFFISDREVTVAQFRQFHAAASSAAYTPAAERLTDWTGEYSFVSPATNCPVQEVSWFDAVKFCNWLSRQEDRTPCYSGSGTNWQCDLPAGGYRLPTEAEWEYACRAGSESRFAFGDDDKLLGEYGWYILNSSQTWPAGSKLPNLWGLFDLHGNVWEWCQDWYSVDYYWYAAVYYQPKLATDPPGPETGIFRVLRGGSWFTINPADLSGSYRYHYIPVVRDAKFGFRCVGGGGSVR